MSTTLMEKQSNTPILSFSLAQIKQGRDIKTAPTRLKKGSQSQISLYTRKLSLNFDLAHFLRR